MHSTLPGGKALSRRLARGSIVAFGIHVGGAGLTYCSQLLIARSIGAEGFGIYAYVFAWVTMLAYLAVLGFDVSLLRFIPAYRAQGEWPLLRGRDPLCGAMGGYRRAGCGAGRRRHRQAVGAYAID